MGSVQQLAVGPLEMLPTEQFVASVATLSRREALNYVSHCKLHLSSGLLQGQERLANSQLFFAEGWHASSRIGKYVNLICRKLLHMRMLSI